MGCLKLERKYYALTLIVIFLLVTASGVLSITTIMTNDSVSIAEGDGGWIEVHNSTGIYKFYPSGYNLQQAIWSCNGTGGEVILPAVTITITSSILIDVNGITITGQGNGQDIFARQVGPVVQEGNGTILVMGGNLPDGVFKIDGDSENANYDPVEQTLIQHLCINGSGRSFTGIGIQINETKATHIENVDITDIDGYAIKIDDSHAPHYIGGRIKGCGNIINEQPAIFINDSYSFTTIPKFKNLIMEQNYYGCIHQSQKPTVGASSQRGMIVNCYFEETSNVYYGVQASSKWQISDCTMTGDVYHYWIGSVNETFDRILISNNNIEGGGFYNDSNEDSQIYLSKPDSCIIEGNMLTNSDGYGININSASLYVDISDNYILNCGRDGIVLRGNNHIVDGNIIQQCQRGIMAWDGDNTTITGNLINSCSSYGFSSHSNSRDILLADNIINGNSNNIDYSGVNYLLKNNKGYNHNSLFPYYKQANPPTLNENTTAYWYNTTGGWLYQICNAYGTQFYLNMSTTY